MKKTFTVLLVSLWQTVAGAGSFGQAFDAALVKDATFAAARAELASAQQNLPMARALLLPNVSFSVSTAQVAGTRQYTDGVGQPVNAVLDYRSPAQSLNARVPVFNWEGSKKLQYAQVQVKYAEAVFAARQLELLERVTTAFLRRLLVEQAVRVAGWRLDAAHQLKVMARRKLQMGEGTTPELANADAELDMAHVMLLDSQNQLEVADLSLRQITGDNWRFSARLDTGELLTHAVWRPAESSDSMISLLSVADELNPTIAARRYAVELAQVAVARNSAGHYARLDLVLSVSRASNESLSTLNQSVNQRSLGLQLNLPLYSGGYVGASVSQALADSDRAEAELIDARQSVALQLTKTYLAVTTGAAKIDAYDKSKLSHQLAVIAARKGLLAGFATAADVLQSERRIEETRQQRSEALVDYLQARVRLAALTGGVPSKVAAELDTLLATP